MSTRPAGHKAIIEAAREEFSEQGYGATSIRNIAKRAGVSLSALYYYYKGKQELLVAILDDGLDAYFGACDAALRAAGDDPAERLEALVTATVRFRIEHPVKSSIVLTEGRSLEPEHLARYRRNEERGTRQFREVIEQGLADGVFLTPYPDDARRTVIAMCNAIAQWYRADGEVTPDELVERYVSLALTVVEYRPRSVRKAARS
ncbi:TetR/AcrR family transcriptional regulator [Streptomyces sp. VRA16 Mangrove soil]|uniref:TetR/AcrR family transcriptional regulator n=1 Tax=Streptomyces sp. VRA16 Mangrove soil TaxID=2817434 RepID=UPI001A9E1395|nr:TetR/AcrR family transcriptional regulator [Streptomyces sp. VRA16 Mangrove soil]MBO1332748.1 TetR family transcriptional regulator [Streptomyces sp. VRA16 Mangrove soil]